MDNEKSGRITLRMDPGLHAELAQLAPLLGTDLNGLLNQLIRDGLPAARKRADEVRAATPFADKPVDEKIRLLRQQIPYFDRRGTPNFDPDLADSLKKRLRALEEERDKPKES